MLTTEQCIEVAEKVWGLHLDDGRFCKEGQTYPEWSTYDIDYSGQCPLSEVNIIDEVNSWQGFGRTVEAMSLPVYGVFRVNATDMYADYLRGLHSKEILWKQTHLQALEALKND